MFVPSYLELRRSGELHERVEEAYRLLHPTCRLCPRECRVDRLNGEVGVCGTGLLPLIADYGAHYGEEPPLVGTLGSGAIFLGSCNLHCVFCQNHGISHGGEWSETGVDGLANTMLDLARRGCHNINLVSPTHQLPQVLASIELAAEAGLDLPIVYNTSGYESAQALRILDGVVDIYLADAKYGCNEAGEEFSGVPDYWDRCREALVEMQTQVGDLAIDEMGIARHGLIVRHLVLPEDRAHTRDVMRFIAAHVSRDAYVNVMDQYRPSYRAFEYPALDRPITPAEYQSALAAAREADLRRLAE